MTRRHSSTLASTSVALSSRAGGDVVTRPDSRNAEIPVRPTYAATVLLPNEEGKLRINMAGQAKIAYGGRSPWNIIYTKLRQNLRRSFGV